MANIKGEYLMQIPESFMQDLKFRNNIVDVISNYVKLKRSGHNMVGLCPFHSEKTPSFNVYQESESFYIPNNFCWITYNNCIFRNVFGNNCASANHSLSTYCNAG